MNINNRQRLYLQNERALKIETRVVELSEFLSHCYSPIYSAGIWPYYTNNIYIGSFRPNTH